MGHVSQQEPDIILISKDGDQVGFHRIVLRLFSTVLGDIINQSEPVSHISVPASGSVLNHLVNTLTTGVAIAADREELDSVKEVANILGFGFLDWQIGLKRKREYRKFEECKKEGDESLNGFVFESENEDISNCQNDMKIEVIPDLPSELSEKQTEPRLNNGVRFGCDICEKTLNTKKNHKRHTRLIHGTSQKKDIVEKVTPKKDIARNVLNKECFSCDVCEKTFTTKKYRNRHVRKEHEASFKKEVKETCVECQKIHGFNPKNDTHYDCDL